MAFRLEASFGCGFDRHSRAAVASCTISTMFLRWFSYITSYKDCGLNLNKKYFYFSGIRNGSHPRTFITLLFGTVLGFMFATFITSSTVRVNPWLPEHFHHRDTPIVASDPHTGNDLRDAFGPEQDVGKHASNEEVHAHENSSLSQQLQREVRVLCWIMTNPTNHKQKAVHVKRTWGSRCNKLVFMSTVADPLINSVALPVSEGRNNLWAKTKEAFKYIYENHLDEADWFMKADDDT